MFLLLIVDVMQYGIMFLPSVIKIERLIYRFKLDRQTDRQIHTHTHM